MKFQVNALLDDLSGISEAERFSNMILPLAWADFVSIIDRYLFSFLSIIPVV